jgi:serine/threonine protein kinase
MYTKITSFRRRILSPILVSLAHKITQFLICAVILISHIRNSYIPSVEYSSSNGEGASAMAIPAILKVNNGKFDIPLWWRDEATVLEKVKGPYVVKIYGQYKDRAGLDVIVLEKIDGHPIFRPASIYKASFAVKMRVLRELLSALRHVHGKGIKEMINLLYRILSQ